MTGTIRTVAFAGHARGEDLGNLDALGGQVRAALAQVWEALGPETLLMVGEADGADQLAMTAWRDLGGVMAPVHPFLPKPDDSFAAQAEKNDRSVWLDGAAEEGGDSHPHLDQTRWLIGYADLLVAVWSGSPSRGPGGTADAAALAVGSNVPMVWIRPGREGPARLIAWDRVADQTELAELAAGYGAPLPIADAAAIAAELAETRSEAPGPIAPRAWDRFLAVTLWRSYAFFRRSAGGRPPPSADVPLPPPDDLTVQPGYIALTEFYDAAECHATEQAGIHRSEQLLLVLLAVCATAVGASPLPKLVAIVTEFALALLALAIWWSAERAHRHERWGLARHDAEELRIARAAWAIGVRPWIGSRGIAAVVPPRGTMASERRLRWARWGLAELIDGQRGYHLRQGAIDRRISHRLERLENVTFTMLLVTMASVIATTIAYGGIDALPFWVGEITVMIGALVPVIGASSMALEAKFGFSEHAARSRQLAERLAQIASTIPADASARRLVPPAREAIAALRAEGTLWAEGIHRRVLFRA